MTELDESDLGKVIAEYEEAFFDIPFGNSKFQIENFIINGAHTPERAYRAIGLTMRAKIQALREAYYALKKQEVDIEEAQEKVASAYHTKWEKKRAAIEIEQKEEMKRDAKKLINDALAELSYLYAVFQKMPRFTRDQFEAGERKYFEIRLQKMAAGIQGALESLDNMGVDVSQVIGRHVPKLQKVTDTLKLVE
jgi:hypothetical protein